MPRVQAPAHLSGKGSQECHGRHPSEARGIQVGVTEKLVMERLVSEPTGNVFGYSLALVSLSIGDVHGVTQGGSGVPGC